MIFTPLWELKIWLLMEVDQAHRHRAKAQSFRRTVVLKNVPDEVAVLAEGDMVLVWMGPWEPCPALERGQLLGIHVS